MFLPSADEASMKELLLSREKSAENKNMSNLFAQPDSPEASIRCLSIYERAAFVKRKKRRKQEYE
jgi:hypothetical protein